MQFSDWLRARATLGRKRLYQNLHVHRNLTVHLNFSSRLYTLYRQKTGENNLYNLMARFEFLNSTHMILKS